MHVIVAYHHAAEAGRLQRLLGGQHRVEGRERLPEQGPIAADVLVTTRLTADEAARLAVKLVQAPGAGLDSIALDALPPDCAVCNVHGHEVPIAEFVLHAVLEHRLGSAAHAWPLDAQHWPAAFLQRPRHREAAGSTLLVLGFGHIGREIAQRAKACGIEVIAVTRKGAAEPMADRTFAFADLRAALPLADTVVLCCPLTDATRGAIGAAEIACMKPDALLINVARAEVAQEAALFEALREQRIARAVLDVWYAYPRAGDTALAPSRLAFHTLPNVRCTPHVSGWTESLAPRRYQLVAQNIQRLADNLPLHNRVR
jgi:phosphoglycerate dehydrogenase-like enzyme